MSETLPNTVMLNAANMQTTLNPPAAGSLLPTQGARPAQPGLPQLPPHLLGQLQQMTPGQQPALQQFLAMQMARQQVSWTEQFTVHTFDSVTWLQHFLTLQLLQADTQQVPVLYAPPDPERCL